MTLSTAVLTICKMAFAHSANSNVYQYS